MCWDMSVRLSCPTPIFTLVSGDVRLVPELGSVLNKLHSVLLTAKVCETQIKSLRQVSDRLWHKYDKTGQEKGQRERLVKGSVTLKV